jgi:hypothetical protein
VLRPDAAAQLDDEAEDRLIDPLVVRRRAQDVDVEVALGQVAPGHDPRARVNLAGEGLDSRPELGQAIVRHDDVELVRHPLGSDGVADRLPDLPEPSASRIVADHHGVQHLRRPRQGRGEPIVERLLAPGLHQDRRARVLDRAGDAAAGRGQLQGCGLDELEGLQPRELTAEPGGK